MRASIISAFLYYISASAVSVAQAVRSLPATLKTDSFLRLSREMIHSFASGTAAAMNSLIIKCGRMLVNTSRKQVGDRRFGRNEFADAQRHRARARRPPASAGVQIVTFLYRYRGKQAFHDIRRGGGIYPPPRFLFFGPHHVPRGSTVCLLFQNRFFSVPLSKKCISLG